MPGPLPKPNPSTTYPAPWRQQALDSARLSNLSALSMSPNKWIWREPRVSVKYLQLGHRPIASSGMGSNRLIPVSKLVGSGSLPIFSVWGLSRTL